MASSDSLVRKRGTVKAQLTRHKNFLSTFDTTQPKEHIESRLTDILKLCDKFEIIQEGIENIEEVSQEDEREAFENEYWGVVSHAKQLLARYQRRSTSEHIMPPSPSLTEETRGSSQIISHVKLPTIDLPKFNGQFENWMHFCDMFNSLIHVNDSLSSVQKFHYLKCSLTGDAAQIISSLHVTDSNYDVAWNLLKERYDNQRLIINNHIKALFEFPNIQKEAFSTIRQLVDNTLKHLRALKSLNQPTDHWDLLIIHIISIKLDVNTRKEWELHIKNTSELKLKDLTDFLINRAQVLENIHSNSTQQSAASNHKQTISKYVPNQYSKYSQKPTEQNKSYVSQEVTACPVCKSNHGIYQCKKFLAMLPNQRTIEVKKLKLCLNCLRSNHYVTTCHSNSVCRVCNQKHNTLLHVNEVQAIGIIKNDSSSTDDKVISAHASYKTNQVLLSTAVIKVNTQNGKSMEVRALLDQGSQSNFITERLCKSLNLAVDKINIPVIGIHNVKTNITKRTTINIQSRTSSFQAELQCLVVKQITEQLPNSPFTIQIPKKIKLADQQFYVPRDIDMLIGASIFYDLLCVGQIKLAKDQPTFQNTRLGWIVGGNITANQKSGINQINCHLNIEEQIQQFWELENINNPHTYSREERECERIFKETVSHDFDGHYRVALPFDKTKKNQLGNSQTIATQRLLALEKKFKANPEFKSDYIKVMREYQEMGHMEEVDEINYNKTNLYYMPHHAILKPISESTKLRVVFDASCKTETGLSLNDVLLVGPTIQDDLISIIIRFRSHQFAVTADIEKMYRMIRVREDQTDYQRIVWRETSTEPIKHYKMTTVSFGTASAPFLAIRCLHEVADEIKHSNPTESLIIKKDFYVDDLITGSDSIEQTKQLTESLSNRLQERGFLLRKWACNEPLIIQHLNQNQNANIALSNDTERGMLGLGWNPHQDTLHYNSKPITRLKNVTKRFILSTISKIFDPLGLIGPLSIQAKILMQELWKLKLEWDENVPLEIHTKFLQIYNDMQILNKISIPRYMMMPDATEIQLHGFADSSIQAYGACVYLRVTDKQGNIKTQLVTAKARVAPIKSITLPRLELCAATVLAHLMKKVKDALYHLPISNLTYWSDSTITLAWISKSPTTWKTFIANRVAEIQQLTEEGTWRHVRSEDNPADIISRGTDIQNIVTKELWWHGPTWLQTNNWPESLYSNETTSEQRKVTSLTTTKVDSLQILNQYSSFSKLQHIIAYCLRFIKRSSKRRTTTRELNCDELEQATKKIIRMVQEEQFSEEKRDLKLNNELNKKSRLLPLNPFIDDDDLIRVGGRIGKSECNIDQKHPYILPKNHHVTKLIIEHEHQRLFHCGVEQLLSNLRRKYWPLSGRNAIKGVIRACLRCFKVHPKPMQHKMGELPSSRVTATARPFIRTGIDYAGPIFLKQSRSRGKPIITKGYICIFVCFTTKATHLELVSDLTSDAYIAAFTRFTGRRGLCKELQSDNGTNFVGAYRKMKELYRFLVDNNEQIKRQLAEQKIDWHFIPPRSPHFGGLWESTVKLVKTHLAKVLQNSLLTFEQYNTLLIQIEAVINSRPITALSSDPTDLIPLTPSHFLIGDILINPIEENLEAVSTNRLSYWHKIQQIKQHFWRRWHHDYLHQLQIRSKWHTTSCRVEPGMLVLCMEDNLPPLKWSTARITEVYPGDDGIVRVVKVKSASGEYKRPVKKLCLLPSV